MMGFSKYRTASSALSSAGKPKLGGIRVISGLGIGRLSFILKLANIMIKSWGEKRENNLKNSFVPRKFAITLHIQDNNNKILKARSSNKDTKHPNHKNQLSGTNQQNTQRVII